MSEGHCKDCEFYVHIGNTRFEWCNRYGAKVVDVPRCILTEEAAINKMKSQPKYQHPPSNN